MIPCRGGPPVCEIPHKVRRLSGRRVRQGAVGIEQPVEAIQLSRAPGPTQANACDAALSTWGPGSNLAYNPPMSPEPGAAWRLIVSPQASGPRNMAIDEALLEAVEADESPPTMRLYAWDPPCLSLGVAQPAADVDLTALRRAGWDLVRRPTGGRAILHTDELTYSIVARLDDPLVTGGILPSYRRLSQGLLAALAELGLATRATTGEGHDPGPSGNPVCFENPGAYEITAGERKLIGSAQVRRKRGVLQHGTLPLKGDLGRICQVLRFDSPQARLAAAERVRGRAATVESLLGNSPAWSTVAEAFKVGFEQALGIVLEPGQPTDEERRRAEALLDERYGLEEWTFRV